jgi:hypothetical protein
MNTTRENVTARSALRFEWIRVSTLRSSWVLIAVALGLQFLCSLIYGTHRDMSGISRYTASFALVVRLAAVMVSAIGVLAFEHQQRTIIAMLLTIPSRGRILLAKSLVTGGLGVLTGVGLVVANELGLVAGGGPLVLGSAAMKADAGVVLYVALAGLVGLAVSGLTRQAVLSLALLIVWPILLEEALLEVMRINPDWFPYVGTAEWFTKPAAAEWFTTLPLIALAAVLLAASAITLTRRDA